MNNFPLESPVDMFVYQVRWSTEQVGLSRATLNPQVTVFYFNLTWLPSKSIQFNFVKILGSKKIFTPMK